MFDYLKSSIGPVVEGLEEFKKTSDNPQLSRHMKDIAGQRFGRLVAIALAFQGKYKVAHWRCLCDCGIEVIVICSRLTKGNTRSCGCLARDVTRQRMIKPEGESSKNNLFYRYKKQARRNNREFSLTFEEFIEITSLNCDYCGKTPSTYEQQPRANGFYCYNGIDRADNSLGYTRNNSVPCCKECNFLKKANNKEQFIALAMRIANHQHHLDTIESLKDVSGVWWGGFPIGTKEDLIGPQPKYTL